MTEHPCPACVLKEARAKTAVHLQRAAAIAGAHGDLAPFNAYLEHDELELAADVLDDFGDEREVLSRTFWESMKDAYENMGLGDEAMRCRFRIYEAEHGFVEARLTLTATEEGGRSHAVFTDYRPDWNMAIVPRTGNWRSTERPSPLKTRSRFLPVGPVSCGSILSGVRHGRRCSQGPRSRCTRAVASSAMRSSCG